MARDLSRAGTEIYVAPCYKLTYDADGYCVKMTICAIPEDIAEKLAELIAEMKKEIAEIKANAKNEG